jgi:diaminohydroxyphosphoribosylaminopyrimidine deaminase / 5-amino-6-(5-phosphoribosylamino)uracil reductase
VTLEPCSTEGKTGACTRAILSHKIGRVVVGTLDPNPNHAGAGIDLLRKAKVAVAVGCREDEATNLIRYFAKHITTRRPYVIAKSAITLDGRTVLRSEDGSWITGKAALEDVQRLRRQVDAILVGGETVRRDNPRLTLRGEFCPRSSSALASDLDGDPQSPRKLPPAHRRTQRPDHDLPRRFAGSDPRHSRRSKESVRC